MAYSHMNNKNLLFSSFHRGIFKQAINSPPLFSDVNGSFTKETWYADG